jgi:hypothetical protein
MAYVSDFDRDIFIVHARPASETDAQDARWIEQFESDLRQLLYEKLGAVDIFFDGRDFDSDENREKIESLASRSALILVVVSPNFIAGTVTGTTLDVLRDFERMIVVELLPLDQKNTPPQFRRLRRAQFWVRSASISEAIKRLSRESDPNEYKERLQALCHTISRSLHLINSAGNREERPWLNGLQESSTPFGSYEEHRLEVEQANARQALPAGGAGGLSLAELGQRRAAATRVISTTFEEVRENTSRMSDRVEAAPLSIRHERESSSTVMLPSATVLPAPDAMHERAWPGLRSSKSARTEYFEDDVEVGLPRRSAQAPQASSPPRRSAQAPQASLPLARRGHTRSRRGTLRYAVALGAALGAAWIFWRFRHELAAMGSIVTNLFRSSVPPFPAPASDGQEDIVDVSAFAPESGNAGENILVQVFLHRVDDATIAKALARKTDAEATHRGIATLTKEIARGQNVEIILEAPGLEIAEPLQSLIWRGEPRACQFLVSLPAEAAGRTSHFRVRLFLGTKPESIPVGSLYFAFKVHDSHNLFTSAADIQGDLAQRYKYAFLSYASADRAEVLKRAQALKAARIDFFHDLLSMEPGTLFEPRLFQEIDRCDLFMLFWSSSAAQSEWVRREAEYALVRQRASRGAVPDITPIILEGPPVPKPPETLKGIHFNDAIRYVIAAIESE